MRRLAGEWEIWVSEVSPSRTGGRNDSPMLQGAGVALGLCVVVLLVIGFHLIVDVRLPSLLAFAAFTLAALATGHLLGGPDAGERTALAVACASRHIGLALWVAANYRGPRPGTRCGLSVQAA